MGDFIAYASEFLYIIYYLFIFSFFSGFAPTATKEGMHTRRSGYTGLLAIPLSCAASTTLEKNYRLTSISDPQPTEERSVSVFVNLGDDSGNTVPVFNWGKYCAFRIYHAETPLESFQQLGDLNAGPAGSSLSLLPFFLQYMQ